MDKIKKLLGNIWLVLKRRPYLSSGVGLLLLSLVLFLPIMRFNWISYPESLKIRIAIKRLLESMEMDTYCREDCSLKRHLYESIISESLRKNPPSYRELLEERILDPGISIEARKELLKILVISDIGISDRIKDFITDSKKDLHLRLQLAKAWPENYPDSLKKEILQAYSRAKTKEDKMDILKLIEGEGGQEAVSLNWNILLSDEKTDLKKQALFSLANIADKKSAYILEDLYKLQLILEEGGNPARLKDQVIFLLNEYYDYFPDQSAALLIEVVNSNAYDDYQKTFAINILNRHRSIPLPLPPLTQEDWDSYYNN